MTVAPTSRKAAHVFWCEQVQEICHLNSLHLCHADQRVVDDTDVPPGIPMARLQTPPQLGEVGDGDLSLGKLGNDPEFAAHGLTG